MNLDSGLLLPMVWNSSLNRPLTPTHLAHYVLINAWLLCLSLAFAAEPQGQATNLDAQVAERLYI